LKSTEICVNLITDWEVKSGLF